jgi:transposase InsO family protein
MQEESLKARIRKRFKCTTMSDHDQPVADNLLDRQFTADAPNQRWVGDTSEFIIGESGKLYLAAILDLFSRFIVGWAISAINDRHLTIKALKMAVQRRCPERGLLHHSDQGCTYASEDYQAILEAHGITCSMSRRGNCHDNAVMEAFFSSLKTELADRFESCGAAKMALFNYIEVFYNQRRRHSTIGYVSPATFERRALLARTSSQTAADIVSGGILQPAPTDDRRSWGILSMRSRSSPIIARFTVVPLSRRGARRHPQSTSGCSREGRRAPLWLSATSYTKERID